MDVQRRTRDGCIRSRGSQTKENCALETLMIGEGKHAGAIGGSKPDGIGDAFHASYQY
jgi:hypothetical protein